jgi:predicted DNA-binding transcriptional regulator AlpA
MNTATLSPHAMPIHPGESIFIDRTEAARLLHLSTTSFDRLRRAGKVGPREIRLGDAPRWNRADFKAWAELAIRTGELHDAATWPAIRESLSEPPAVVAA